MHFLDKYGNYLNTLQLGLYQVTQSCVKYCDPPGYYDDRWSRTEKSVKYRTKLDSDLSKFNCIMLRRKASQSVAVTNTAIAIDFYLVHDLKWKWWKKLRKQQ